MADEGRGGTGRKNNEGYDEKEEQYMKSIAKKGTERTKKRKLWKRGMSRMRKEGEGREEWSWWRKERGGRRKRKIKRSSKDSPGGERRAERTLTLTFGVIVVVLPTLYLFISFFNFLFIVFPSFPSSTRTQTQKKV